MSTGLDVKRVGDVIAGYRAHFEADDEIMLCSAPGRTEIGGNHTDHQHGCVLCAAVDRDMTAAVSMNRDGVIRLYSEGFGGLTVNTADLAAKKTERYTSSALVRGLLSAFSEKGAALSGLDIYMRSDVPAGSGMSSSAAFEVLLGTAFNEAFHAGLSPLDIAKAGQYAENTYFGKPCGLMDQMASAFGGVLFIDFHDPQEPFVETISRTPEDMGISVCLIDTGASHEGLTADYAAVTAECRQVAKYFGKEVLADVRSEELLKEIPKLKGTVPDRAILRALHFFHETGRAKKEAEALKKGNSEEFLKLVRASGKSSYELLQNVIPCGAAEHQEMALALSLAEGILGEKGAVRVHGGGFAGTIQAFVPTKQREEFAARMDGFLGKGSCRIVKVRREGGVLFR